MSLDFKFKVKKKSTVKKKYELTEKQKANRTRHTIQWIYRKYHTGDLDLNKTSHMIAAKIAISKGIIPEEVIHDERFYHERDTD